MTREGKLSWGRLGNPLLIAGSGHDKAEAAIHPDHVVEGFTNKVRSWMWNIRVPLKDQDLWQCLLGETKRRDELKLEV